MRKRRKRTNKDVPAKGRILDMCDRLWSLAVKADWANRCAVCRRGGVLDSHHLLPRQYTTTRHVLRNGIALCKTHHRLCPDVSPHQNPAGWTRWLTQCHRSLAEWVDENLESCKVFDGITTAWYYIDVLESLREYVDPDDFIRIVGVRFSTHLEKMRGGD